jgi:hypothetical protein
MSRRILMSLMFAVAVGLAFPIQSAIAKQVGDPGPTPGQTSSPIVSEKAAGLNLATQSSVPVGMTKAEYRALMLRSEALDQKYGLGKYATSSPITSEKTAGLNLVTPSSVPAGMTKAEYRALMLRSEALDQKYGLGKFAPTVSSSPITSEKTTGLVQPFSAHDEPVVVSNDGFDWGDAGIGAAALFGTMLLGAAGALTIRRHRGTLAH